jgi:uncharacterized protein YeaO (DUF488 family)
MKIYTGYFAQLAKYEKAGLKPVSVARWSPKWYNGATCITLAPSVGLLNRYKNNQVGVMDYADEYNAFLKTIDVKAIVENAANGRDIVLLCYEKAGDFCHRHLIAKYLNDNFNMGVTEYKL